MADPENVSRLIAELERIVAEWTVLTATWDEEDQRRFRDDVRSRDIAHAGLPFFDGVPVTFLSSTRVVVLRRCTDVLQHLLEAFDG